MRIKPIYVAKQSIREDYKVMENKILVETSARHVHLTKEAVAALYGEGAELIVKKMLSQPGQFATANDKLKLVGPAGEIDIDEGCIIAKRHIHMTPADAEGLGVTNGEVVKVLVKSDRTTIFDDVVVRVSPSYALAMHIDTDECNAAAAFGEIYGEIVK